MADVEIAWAAGLFEGEGCITYERPNLRPRLHLSMTDEDIVRRFAEIVGGSVRRHEHKWRCKDGSFCQVQWRCDVPVDQSVEMIASFWPYLGERRRARWVELFNPWQALVAERYAPRECALPECSRQFVPARGQFSRQRFCSRLHNNRSKMRELRARARQARLSRQAFEARA